MNNFKATYCGAEYRNIDGTGWPDTVVMENQGSVLDGTYESRIYYQERTTRLIWDKHNDRFECESCGKGMKPEWICCPNCGAKIVD